MSERTALLVPTATLDVARSAAPADVALHGYNLIPWTATLRLRRKVGLLNAAGCFAKRWQFPASAPLTDIRALWIPAEAQFGVDEADALLDLLPALRSVYWQRTGIDSLPVDRFFARGIHVHTSRGLTSRWVAEGIVACILADAKLLTHSARDRMPPLAQLTRTLEATRVAILGTGLIGKETARICRDLGMQVIGLARTLEGSATDPFPFHEARESRSALLSSAREADYLVLALPLSENTRAIVDEKVMNALGPQGTLVNLARPGLVDQQAMLLALSRGALGAAFISRLEGPRLWVAWQAKRTRNLFLTHNREAHVAEKPAGAARQFFAMLAAEGSGAR